MERDFEEILQSLRESDNSVDAEDTFIQSLVKEGSSQSEDTSEDEERIRARSFVDELGNLGIFEKNAVGEEVMSPDPDAVPKINPAVELANTGRPEDEARIQAVLARIAQARIPSRVGGGTVEYSGNQTIAANKTAPTGAPPVAYDATKMPPKTAADYVLSTIYDAYFGDGEES